jgi:hypothetical protein
MKKLFRAALDYILEWGNGPACVSYAELANRPVPTYNIVNEPRVINGELEVPRTRAQAEAWGYTLERVGQSDEGNMAYKYKEVKEWLELRPENGGGLTPIEVGNA